MRGIVKAEAGKGLEFRTDLPIPVPGDDEVLMEIRCASICGTDLGIYDWGPSERRSRTASSGRGSRWRRISGTEPAHTAGRGTGISAST